MLDLDSELFSLRRVDRLILEAYYDAEQTLSVDRPLQTEAAGELSELTRWIERIRAIDGVPHDQLAPGHGRLIALGYLQFQLQGRDAGVVYRLTTAGRTILTSAGRETPTGVPVRQSA
ncbi:MAG: hypothetical protein AB7I48_19325 [Planctomycetaceae bacterium]